MNKEELISLIAEKLQVNISEEQLCFRIFVDRMSDLLNKNEAVRLPGIGVFQLKQESVSKVDRITGGTVYDRKYSLLYSPMTEDFASSSKTLFLKIDLPNLRISSDFDDSVFSISINKPLVPFSENLSGDLDNETSYLLLQKTIEEKVKKILSETEKLENFDLWEDYLSTKKTEPTVFESEIESETDFTVEEEFEDNGLNNVETDKSPVSGIKDDINDLKISGPDFGNENELDSPLSADEDDLGTINFEEESETENHVEMLNEILSDDLDSFLDDTIVDDDEVKNDIDEPVLNENIDDIIDYDDTDSESSVTEIKPENVEVDLLSNSDIDELDELEEKKTAAAIKSNESEDDSLPAPVAEEKKPDDTFNEDELGNVPPVTKRKFSLSRTNLIIIGAIVGVAILVNVAYFIFFSGSESGETEKVEEAKSGEQSQVEEADDGEEKTGVDLSKYKLSLNGDKEEKSGSNISDTTDLKLTLKPGEQTSAGNTHLIANDTTSKSVAGKTNELYQNITNETRLSNSNIFLDSKGYNIQVSSWKQKAKAELETNRLRKAGYNAFITEAFLEKFGGTWYRVRIGYYSTEKEAKEVEKKIN